MKKLLRLLPVFALLLGLGASGVSAANSKRVPAVRKHQVSGAWVEVVGDYRCLNEPTPICTQLFDESTNQPIPNSADYGTFTQP